MRKKIICPVICLICLMAFSSVYAETVWKEVGRGIRGSDFRAVATNPGNRETAYISSPEAVYKTTDGGLKWEIVFSSGSTGHTINTIAVDAGNVYVGTGKGLYRSKDEGSRWEGIFSGIGGDESGALFVAVDPGDPDAIFIGTGSGCFFSGDGGHDWEKGRGLPPDSGVHYIAIDHSDTQIVYAAADNGLYKSLNRGVDWARIREANVPEEETFENEGEYGETEEAEDMAEIRSIAIHPADNRMVFAATSRGLLITKDSGLTWKSAGSIGLASRDIRHISVNNKGSVYTATDCGVFEYSLATESWKEAFDGLGSMDVRYIAPAEGGEADLLWAAAERGVFKTITHQTAAGYRAEDAEGVLLKFADDPSIEELREAAIIYAEVHPGKIKRWRKAAERKALLPDLQFEFDKNKGWQSSTYYYTTSTQKYKDDDITTDKDSGWSVSLTWELGELIWNNDQTSIDSRSRYAVQLRDDLLNEVTRLFFERRRLQVAMLVSPSPDIRESLENELRLQELTAGIDALTDSYLSKRLNKVLGNGRDGQ